jgi:hypothetical protein
VGAKIPLGRLNRGVAEEQLDLLKLSARSAAQLRARVTQNTRRDAWHSDFG